MIARFDPAIEKRLWWQETEESLLHKWDVYQKFDPIVRLFGEGKKVEKQEAEDLVNPASLEMAIRNMITKAGE